MKQKCEELFQKNRQIEVTLRKKEEEVFKLRQDNHSMFNDLKGLASNEESYKFEMIENKQKRQEMEQLNQDLQEKILNQELRIKSLN